MTERWGTRSLALLTAFTTLLLAGPLAYGTVLLAEDFDGGGMNSVYTYTNSGGSAPGTINVGGVNQNTAQLTQLTGGNNNSIAFDGTGVLGSPALRISFDFRGTDDAANAAVGGCCGEAADGFGIGLYDTGLYGTSGGINPGAIIGGGTWENPTLGSGFPGGVHMGFDVFDAGGPNGNNIRVTGLSGSAELLIDVSAPFPLNNNLFHRAEVTVTDIGTDSVLSLTLIEDVNGTAITHANVFSGLTATGLDLDTANARLIAGGRTGGAFVQVELDNIMMERIPEPSAFWLLGFGGIVLWFRRRVY